MTNTAATIEVPTSTPAIITIQTVEPQPLLIKYFPTPKKASEIIKEVSEKREANTGLLLAIAKAESDLDPYVSNPLSTASGLFQILDGTWNDFGCRGTKLNAYDSTECAITILKQSGPQHWNETRSKWEYAL